MQGWRGCKVMIGYATLGTNDIDRSRAFYTELLKLIGAKELMRLPEGFTMFGVGMDQPGIALTPPFNGEAASPGNGQMLALVVTERHLVDKLHSTALALGGSCEGPPGLRPPEAMQFYAAYFRDLDGNKLCAFRVGQA
jgi:catechol 2,3-dioxygenase-like lactoylglutathione lyase family enzyme